MLAFENTSCVFECLSFTEVFGLDLYEAFIRGYRHLLNGFI
jgi:hypothetical protein